ncbi:MAG: hypothetical protein OEZ23_08560, partial [Gammaproteobacteria bacterium]|nr:hypothetical protein [Gammaproteobacteria bacterium]
MKTSNVLTAVFVLSFISSISYAEGDSETRFGIGAEIDSKTTFYFPIDFGTWVLEPEISFYDAELDSGALFSTQHYNSEGLTLGFGLFKKKHLNDKSSLYLGFRTGYFESESSTVTTGGFLGGTIARTDSDGYYIAPTIGVQYEFVPNLSLGLDLSVRYTDRDGTNTVTSGTITTTSDSDSTDTSSQAKII